MAAEGQPEPVVSAMNRSGVRDIQFDCPQILVEACATREEIGNFGGTRRFGGSDALPAIAAVEVQNALQAGDVRARGC